MDTYKKSAPLFGLFLFQEIKPVYNENKFMNGVSLTMSKQLYSNLEMKLLEDNPNVARVSESSITYHPLFKKTAIQEYQKGKFPTQIFEEHGFDLNVIGKKQPQRCLKRWRETHEKYGELGLEGERRGKGSTGRPSSKDLSAEEKLKKAEARIKYLEAENEFLKKLDELERQALKKKRK
jgi:transposase